jgi:hypothetical protein
MGSSVMAVVLAASAVLVFMDRHRGRPMLGRGINGHTSGMVLLDFKATGEVEGTMISAAGGLEAASDKQSSDRPRVTNAYRMRRQETWG